MSSAPDSALAAETSRLEELLRRDRMVTIVGLTVLCVLAWIYILRGAGLGMSAWEMTRVTLFPHLQTDAYRGMAGHMDMPGMDMAPNIAPWHPSTWLTMIAMWWVMMIAMMTPSAAPTALLYARVYRQAQMQGHSERLAPTGIFVIGFLAMWFGFAVVAAQLQWIMTQSGVLDQISMASSSAYLSATVLLAAGIYEFSFVKDVCLARCRNPASFLSGNWKPGISGAFMLGAIYGAYCVGCCWLLMALLFVGGIMNLAWIAILAVLVMAEKLLGGGVIVARTAGVLLCFWAVLTLVV